MRDVVKNDVPASFGNAYTCLTCKHLGDDLDVEPCKSGLRMLPDCEWWEAADGET
jgi:hypothetical protein